MKMNRDEVDVDGGYIILEGLLNDTNEVDDTTLEPAIDGYLSNSAGLVGFNLLSPLLPPPPTLDTSRLLLLLLLPDDNSLLSSEITPS